MCTHLYTLAHVGNMHTHTHTLTCAFMNMCTHPHRAHAFSLSHIRAHTRPNVSPMPGGEKSPDFSLFLKPGQHSGLAAAGAGSVFALPVTPNTPALWALDQGAHRRLVRQRPPRLPAWSGMYKPPSSVTWPLTVPTREWQHAPLPALPVVAMTDLLMNSS